MTRRDEFRNPERDRLIRVWLGDGTRTIKQVVEETGLSRARIYDIRRCGDDPQYLERRRERQRAWQKRRYDQVKAAKAQGEAQ